MNYYWIRIFDYKDDEELSEYTNIDIWEKRKGTLLDEYYLCGSEMTRSEVKEKVKERSNVNRFAKPHKGNGIYALIMESNKFFYERFTIEVDTKCFNCFKSIKGKLKDFPRLVADNGNTHYFCSYKCKRDTELKINPHIEGEWQEREDYTMNGGVYGYIYHIYNRKNNMHYIGQTVYMPFFRWQEHVKQGAKGNITDLAFEVVTEVRVKSQKYLNNIEAWWINKFIDEYGRENVMNIAIPKITIEDLEKEYANIIGGQMILSNISKSE